MQVPQHTLYFQFSDVVFVVSTQSHAIFTVQVGA